MKICLRAQKKLMVFTPTASAKARRGGSRVHNTAMRIIPKIVHYTLLNLNWDFVLYLAGRRTERVLSELFIPYEKTTCEKAGRTSTRHPGNPGIRESPEFKLKLTAAYR